MATNNNNYRIKPSDAFEKISNEEYEFRIAEIKKCVADPLYFAEHYFTIITLDEGEVIIKPYPKQA